jgi:hypothetical protein
MILNSGTRVKMMAVGALAFVLGGADSLSNLHDYVRAGTEPTEMNLDQARAASASHPFIRRWVRLTEPLDLNCGQRLHERVDGEIKSIIVVAFDSSKEQPVLVEYEHPPNGCEELKSVPLEGMLIQPELKYWTTHGMAAPSAKYPLLGLRVGENPSALLTQAELLGGVAIISLGMLVFAYRSKTN